MCSSDPTYMPRPPGFASHPPAPMMIPRQSQGQQRANNQVQHKQSVETQQRPSSENPPRPKGPRSLYTCNKCGELGHISPKCPQNKLQTVPSSVPTPSKAFNYNNKPGTRSVWVNHIKAGKAEEAPEVVLGTLLVNSIPAKVLFDTGASHSFVSKIFATTNKLPFVCLGVPASGQLPGSNYANFQDQSRNPNSNWRSFVSCFPNSAWQFRH